MGDWKRAIAIDFDGTICESKYPDIGKPNWNIINQAIQEQAHGAGLIAARSARMSIGMIRQSLQEMAVLSIALTSMA